MEPGAGPLSPDFSGMDPTQMDGFISELERGRDVIDEQSERIGRLLAAAEVPAAGLHPIREVGGWVRDELPKLRRRLETIPPAGPARAVRPIRSPGPILLRPGCERCSYWDQSQPT